MSFNELESVTSNFNPCLSGYVDSLKKLLFTLPKSKLKEILARWAAKAPEPLNRQFPERLNKEEAIKGYNAKKQMKKTTLFPPGWFSIYFFV